MFKTIKKLFYLFDKRTRIQIGMLFLMMILGSVFEAGGIGLVVPFIAIVTDPGILGRNQWLLWIKQISGAESQIDFLIILSLGFVGFYLTKNIYLGLMNYLQFRFVFAKRSELGKKVFKNYICYPYSFHLEWNRAELLRNIDFAVTKVYGFVQSLLKVCTELCILAGILTLLVIVNPLIVIFSVGILGGLSGAFYKSVGRYATYFGETVQSSQRFVSQAVLEGFGSIKEIKLHGMERFFPDRYYHHMMVNARANWMQSTLNLIPRLFLEVVAVASVIAMIVLFQLRGESAKTLMPMLGLFAVATIRLMPSLSNIVTNLHLLRFHSPAVEVIYKDIEQSEAFKKNRAFPERSVEGPLAFNHEVRIEKVGYHYPNSDKKALSNISLNIQIGETIAFVGASGAGKTTLANLVLGLLEPSEGTIYSDGHDIFKNIRTWQAHIGFVPQAIYLLDADIRCNIAFGVEEDDIDDLNVWHALQTAQLDQFVSELPNGLNTIVGEDGVRLSGGQRQRLGIARALYHQPDILLLDEATSALDNETEKEVNRAIDALTGQKTLIIIAHRLSTVKSCDRIYFMESGSITDSGKFEDLITRNSKFKAIADSGSLLT
ncbi:ABC transporter ATP-binding protein [Thermodesulfobacteriota bacterium]